MNDLNDLNLNISDELLQNLSLEQLADLKIEVEELETKIDSLIEECDEVLNS